MIGQPQAGEVLSDGEHHWVVDWSEGLTWIDPLLAIACHVFWPMTEDRDKGRKISDALLEGFRRGGGADIRPDDPAINLWLAFRCIGDGLFLLRNRQNRILDEHWPGLLRQLLEAS